MLKTRTRCLFLLTCFILWPFSAWGQGSLGLLDGSSLPPNSLSSDPASRMSLEINMPQEGKTYDRAVTVRGKLLNAPGDFVLVRLECFDVVHHTLLESTGSGYSGYGGGRWSYDKLPSRPGNHTLQVSVWTENSTSPLLEKTIHFTLVKPTNLDQQLPGIRRVRKYQHRSIDEWRQTLQIWESLVRLQPSYREKLTEVKADYHMALVNTLAARSDKMVSLGSIYESAMDPDRALACYLKSQELWETQSPALPPNPTSSDSHFTLPNKIFYPPLYFDRLIQLYWRCGHVEEAEEWLHRKVRFFQDQLSRHDLDGETRSLLAKNMAWTTIEIGRLHVALRNDLEAYRQWQQEADKIRREHGVQ